ncbi:MAG: cytochrome b5 domain-containing protein, partial [Patescibacteria group bacterium]|nr:cytochrome b5 domain-containing protein [Patescibacteria group bacterium]
VIRENVYDLTSWITKHPGGEKAILNLCGKDGTSLFEKQHGGEKIPEDALAKFKIGKLLKTNQ